ncbi:MAG: hypothetical protein CMI29_08435 [Opitutae bacterium]|nr:hypothetical protein [Opitutae bacterium]
MAPFLPDLGRLSLDARPTCPTSAGKNGSTAARDAVLETNDLLVLILTALNKGNRDDVCQLVQKWCATHTKACNREFWSRVRDLIFPTFKNARPQQHPKHHLLWLCRRWNRGRFDRFMAIAKKVEARGDLVVPREDVSYDAETHDENQFAALATFLEQQLWDLEDEDEYVAERPEGFQGYEIYWFCIWALNFAWRTDPNQLSSIPLRLAIEAGYISLRHNMATPVYDEIINVDKPRFYEGQAFCFFAPYTLLYIAILKTTANVLQKVRWVLKLGVDPNQRGVEPLNFVSGSTLIPDNVLRPDDEGGIEMLALYHITHFLYDTHRYTGTYDKQDARVFLADPENLEPPEDDDAQFTPEKQKVAMYAELRSIYAELHKYGGEMYKAAMMYRAYFLLTLNPVLLEYAEFLSKLADGMWELQVVSKEQEAQWFEKAMKRARSRFPKIEGVSFDDRGHLQSLGALENKRWDDLHEPPEVLSPPRTPTREEVDGFFAEDAEPNADFLDGGSDTEEEK